MQELKELLVSQGADLVGFADLGALHINNEMPYGVSVAIRLSPELISSIHNGPTEYYFEEYHRINHLLNKIVTAGEAYFIKNGFKAFAQTTASVVLDDTNYKTELPHKTVATRAGLGWIGKCGLLVTREYGSGVRISSLLTNARLDCGKPFENSLCGDCAECVENCPARAITGKLWNKNTERSELIDVYKCSAMARKISKEKINREVTLCGKCFEVCPYTIKCLALSHGGTET